MTQVFDQLIEELGLTENMRPEFPSRRMLGWAEDAGIQPGRPMQNDHLEGFPGCCATNAAMQDGSAH